MNNPSALRGVPMLYTPPEMHPAPSPGFEPAIWVRQSMVVAREVAISLGAEVITSQTPDDPLPEGGMVLTPRPDPHMKRLRRVEHDFLRTHPDLPRVESIPLENCDDGELRARLADGPLMLAYRGAHRGLGKYRLDTPKQYENVLRLAQERPDLGVGADFEVRPFIETPTDRFVTYRAVVNPLGGLLSSRIFVSGHTKDTERHIVRDRFQQSKGSFSSIQEAFEDPDSPYFLNSVDIRSNAGGGFGIALEGGLEAPYWDDKRLAILESLGIDPNSITTPPSVLSIGSIAGKACGAELDTGLGIDVIPAISTPATPAGNYYLEENPGAGAGPHWSRKGEAGLECFVNMRAASLLSMAYPDVPYQESLQQWEPELRRLCAQAEKLTF